MKKVLILGSTGSIGTNTLEVIRHFKNKFEVVGISGHSNIDLLSEQIKEFKPKYLGITKNENYKKLKKQFSDLEYFTGSKCLENMARDIEYDIIVVSVVGAVGLKPVIEAVKRGKRVAIANKEPLVIAGEYIMKMAKKNNAEILPIDSEHSAIFQSLKNEKTKNLSKILLTASGGPFFDKKIDFKTITPKVALKHPNWSMGQKISIDSATLMNKGLEVIEAKWLFDVTPSKIRVVIHPQSIIHSMVEYKDGSIIAQLGVADMKVPIQYALSYPDRYQNDFEKLDFFKLKELTFFKPNVKKFKCLKLAFESIKIGGIMPTVLNASNEIAVYGFLKEKIRFDQIAEVVENSLEKFSSENNYDLDSVFEIDKRTRLFSKNQIKNLSL